MEEMNIHQQLFEAKQEIGAVSKDSRNPFFKSKYFDINKLLEVVEPVLNKYDILLLQPLKDGIVTTILITKDGKQSVESSLELPKLNDPQKLGSAITYFRRYTLQSLLGLQAEDDDGNLVNKKQPVAPVKPVAPIKKTLDESGFNFLKSKDSTIQQIKDALSMREMTDEQREILTSYIPK